MSVDGIHDVYVTEGTISGEKFAEYACAKLPLTGVEAIQLFD